MVVEREASEDPGVSMKCCELVRAHPFFFFLFFFWKAVLKAVLYPVSSFFV